MCSLNRFRVLVRAPQFLRYTMFIVLYPSGVLGELGVCFRAIPALLAGGYAGVSTASPVLSHVIRPLLASGSRIVPYGAYLVIVLMCESQSTTHRTHRLAHLLRIARCLDHQPSHLQVALFSLDGSGCRTSALYQVRWWLPWTLHAYVCAAKENVNGALVFSRRVKSTHQSTARCCLGFSIHYSLLVN